MKTSILIVLFAFIAISFALSSEDRFVRWAQTHNKAYESDEELRIRFAVWKENLKTIEEHNSKPNQSFTLGLNQFADMTPAEYRRWLGTPVDSTLRVNKAKEFPTGLKLPVTVDWRTKGVVTHVKNQGQCGSCWSFSTTGSTEGAFAIATGNLVSLSEQQLVDCSGSYGNNGCNGGLMDDAFKYISAVGGLESESEYPYTAQDGSCHSNPSMFKADITSYTDVTSGSESSLQVASANIGPISVAIDASHSSFQFYSGGVYYEPACSSTQLDHGVLVVGYGTSGGSDYWLVKNSWGGQWGLEGYIMMSRNRNNNCGIATMASYPTGAHLPSAKFDNYLQKFVELKGALAPFDPLA